MEFTFQQWCELAKHASDKNLVFLSSPFSLEAVDLLTRIGVEGWKIGSGEFFNDQLLNKIISTKKPILLSTGMSLLDEIDNIVNIFKIKKTRFALMQCTSKYPTDLSEVGLNIMDFCNAFNSATQESEKGMPLPVVINVYEDKSFDFVVKTPPAAVLIRKALNIQKGSGEPNREKVGKLTRAQLEDIAKAKEPDLNANDIDAAVKIIAGTARSMGVEVDL